jgi:hypothetical protein
MAIGGNLAYMERPVESPDQNSIENLRLGAKMLPVFGRFLLAAPEKAFLLSPDLCQPTPT